MVGALFGGLDWFFLRLIRGKPANVGDVFIGFNVCFLPLMLAGLVTTLLTALGLFLCIIPGVYLMVIWMFALPLILDKRLDFWPAMELSRKVVHQQWWALFGLLLLSLIVFFGGLLLLVVGIFFTAPFAIAAVMYAYEDIFGEITPEPLPSLPVPAAPEAPVPSQGTDDSTPQGPDARRTPDQAAS